MEAAAREKPAATNDRRLVNNDGVDCWRATGEFLG
jgi:hypothetical protein